MAAIVITIDPQGKSSVDVEGWTGPSCALLSAPYVHALGQEKDQAPKPEFFAQAEQQQQIKH